MNVDDAALIEVWRALSRILETMRLMSNRIGVLEVSFAELQEKLPDIMKSLEKRLSVLCFYKAIEAMRKTIVILEKRIASIEWIEATRGI